MLSYCVLCLRWPSFLFSTWTSRNCSYPFSLISIMNCISLWILLSFWEILQCKTVITTVSEQQPEIQRSYISPMKTSGGILFNSVGRRIIFKTLLEKFCTKKRRLLCNLWFFPPILQRQNIITLKCMIVSFYNII